MVTVSPVLVTTGPPHHEPRATTRTPAGRRLSLVRSERTNSPGGPAGHSPSTGAGSSANLVDAALALEDPVAARNRPTPTTATARPNFDRPLIHLLEFGSSELMGQRLGRPANAVITRDRSRVARAQMMIGTVPPSALHAAPVTYEARSEQRKTTTAAISSGRARRPRGRPAPTFASTSSRSPPCWSARPPSPNQAAVAVGPGVTALQRIPSFA